MFFRPNKKRFLFVTHNQNKLKEIGKMFPSQHELISLKEISYHDEIPETGKTLEENALQKATTVYELVGYDCFADDTGLEVEALGGEPGVYSARYAGDNASDQDNVSKLLKAMEGEENRRACFRTVIALLINKQEHFFEGRVDGYIAKAPSGEQGFGYDPVFIPEGWDKTFAEMGLAEKNRISHRGKALNDLVRYINMMEVKSLRFWF